MTTDDKEILGNYELAKDKLTTRRELLYMGAVAGLMSLGTAAQAAQEGATKTAAVAPGAPTSSEYKAKDFSALVKKNMEGLSSNQIEQHLKLYSGYITKVNEIQALIDQVDLNGPPAANATYNPYRELLVEQSFALNGVIYHEFYFDNLGGKGGEPGGDLRSAIDTRFGSWGKFMDYFKAAGKNMRGWVVLGWNTRDGRIHVYGLDAHNLYTPANVLPIAVLDVYEHAYMIDYGINRGAYLDAFLKNIDWSVCAKRFAMAQKHPVGVEPSA